MIKFGTLFLAGLLLCLVHRSASAQAVPIIEIEAVHASNAVDMPPQIYVPLMIVHIGGSPGPQSIARPACILSDEEATIASSMTTEPAQQRANMNCDTTLTQVARARARDMAERDYFGHVNPDGLGPNRLVIQAGYQLPESYDLSQAGNNIESIAAGFGTAEEVWTGWMDSSKHRTHLLGEHTFFQQQEEYGIGYYYDPNSTYRHYWVVLTARAGP